MSILVATDFSPCSQSAVRLAAALARRQGAPLVLVHAVEPALLDVPEVPIGSTNWERDRLMAAEVAIAHDASDVRQTGLTVDTRILLGSAASLILEMAGEHKPDLIVLGTHGRKRGAQLFLGSVSETVIRSSPCPVLVTRDTPPDLERWEGRSPLRLSVATDRSLASQAALSWVGTFARAQPCELSLVRVYWPPEEAIRYGLDDPWGGPRRDPELLPLLERDLKRDAASLIGQVPDRLSYRAAGRDAADEVADEVSALGADALVIGIPRRGAAAGWAVVAPGAILRSSRVPVLCVPEATTAAPRQLEAVRSVLIATDMSDLSNQVVRPAYGLLRGTGGRAELCNVYAVGAADAIGSVPLKPALSDEDRSEIESRLRALVPAGAERFGITTGISVLEGRFAAEAILAAAERLDVDVIAVGSHGRSGFKRALLGSVAEEVARKSPRPVMIVRSGRQGAPPSGS